MTSTEARPDDTASQEDAIYADSHDRQRHLGSMRAIADELHRPIDEIAGLYEEVLAQMRAHARIPDYLPVLVSKKVRQLFRQH